MRFIAQRRLPFPQLTLFSCLTQSGHIFVLRFYSIAVMNWIQLTSAQQLEEIKEKSNTKPQVIFKHSTRCSVSSMAKNRLERKAFPEQADFYYLDLIANRQVSSQIERDFSVYHESPQILVIKNGKCVYDESHSGISMEEIKDRVA